MTTASVDVRPSRLLQFGLSPTGCALLSYAVFLVIWAMPKDLYEQMVHEPNIMHFNFNLFLFVTGCVGAFIGGSFLWRRMTPKGYYREAPTPASDSMPAVVLWVVGAAIALNVLSMGMILHNSGNIVGMLLSGSGYAAKTTMNTEGALTEALPLLFALIWWAASRHDQLSSERPLAWNVVRILLVAAIAVAILSATIKLARFELIPFLLGLFIASSRAKIAQRKVSWRFVFGGAVGAPVLVIVLFFAFAALRGMGTMDRQVASLFGYGPASYNRLAALLGGELHYPYGGTGIYIGNFLSHIPLIHDALPIGHWLHMPSTQSAFLSEFVAVHESGLRSDFIWPTALGYYYSDLGFKVFGFFAIMGWVAEAAWSWWNRGSAIGLTFYPFIATSVLLWGSSNLLVLPPLITTLGAALLVSVAEKASRESAVGRAKRIAVMNGRVSVGRAR